MRNRTISKQPKISVSKAVYYRIVKEFPHVLFDPSYTWLVGILLWSLEIFINVFVIASVKCK